LFNAVIAPDFYLFEVGVRLDGPGMLALIKAERDAGKSFEWSVTEPDIRIGGNVAWIAYINRGSIILPPPERSTTIINDSVRNFKLTFSSARRSVSEYRKKTLRSSGSPCMATASATGWR
jgi:hypothetical protein